MLIILLFAPNTIATVFSITEEYVKHILQLF